MYFQHFGFQVQIVNTTNKIKQTVFVLDIKVNIGNMVYYIR